MSKGPIMSILGKVASKIPEVEQMASNNFNMIVDKTDSVGQKINDTVMDIHGKKMAFLNKIKTTKHDILSRTVKGISDDMEEMVEALRVGDFVPSFVESAGDFTPGDFILQGNPILNFTEDFPKPEVFLQGVLDPVSVKLSSSIIEVLDPVSEVLSNYGGGFLSSKNNEPEAFSKSLHQYTFGETMDREAFTGETDIETLLDDFFKRIVINKALSMDKHVEMGFENSYDSEGLSQVVRTEIIPPPARGHKDRPVVEVVNVYNDLKKDPYASYGSKFSSASHKELYGDHK